MGQPTGLTADEMTEFHQSAVLADALNQPPGCEPDGRNCLCRPVEKDTRKPSLLPAGGWVTRIGLLHPLRMPQPKRRVSFYLGTSGLQAVGT